MTKDKVVPAHTTQEYKNMINELVSLNEGLISFANDELSKGFKFSADQILINVEKNMAQICYYEEMVEVIEKGESERYYMRASLKVA